MVRRYLLLLLLLAACGGAVPPEQPVHNSAEAGPMATARPTSAAPTQAPITRPTATRSAASAAARPTSAAPTQAPITRPTATRSAASAAARPTPPAVRSTAAAPADPQLLALRPAALPLPAATQSAPRYHMQLSIDPVAQVVRGTQTITFTNRTGQALGELVLRAYPNFPPDVMGDGGDTHMDISAASLNGQPLTIEHQARDTAFVLRLPAPLADQATIAIETVFSTTLAPWDDGALPLFSAYPLLAVWDAEAGAWRMDVTRFPDHVYAEAAWYTVDVTLPVAWQISATGAAIAASTSGQHSSTTFVSGPVREWAAIIGDFATIQTITADGVAVNVWQHQGRSHDLARIRAMARAALEDYEQRFGPYPYRELDVYAMRWHGGDAGIEYPGLVMILIGDQVNAQTDFVVAHEVAHQWWYNSVGNDIFHAPWLDESLANFSAGEALKISAPDSASELIERNISAPDAANQAQGFYPAGLAIDQYPNFKTYSWAVYGSGAVFLQQLQATMGVAAFKRGLQAFYAGQRFAIARRSDFASAMQRESPVALDALFREWLGP